MALTSTPLTSELFDKIERRIIGSLNAQPFRRINCTNMDVAIDELLGKYFSKKRDLPLNARDHIETVLKRSTKLVVEELGPELITIRVATRHERSKRSRSKHERKLSRRVRVDSRHTRARRPQAAAA